MLRKSARNLVHWGLAAVLLLAKSDQLHAPGKSLRDVAVDLGRDLAPAALGFHHTGQRNELAVCFRTQAASEAKAQFIIRPAAARLKPRPDTNPFRHAGPDQLLGPTR